MTTLPDGSQQSLTAQDVDAWLLATAERHAAIHCKELRKNKLTT